MENTKSVLKILLVFALGAIFSGVALMASPIWRAGAIGYALGVVSILAIGLRRLNRTSKEGGD